MYQRAQNYAVRCDLINECLCTFYFLSEKKGDLMIISEL